MKRRCCAEPYGSPKQDGKAPPIHDFMHFLNGEFFQNIHVVEKNIKTLESRYIKMYNVTPGLNNSFIPKPN